MTRWSHTIKLMGMLVLVSLVLPAMAVFSADETTASLEDGTGFVFTSIMVLVICSVLTIAILIGAFTALTGVAYTQSGGGDE